METITIAVLLFFGAAILLFSTLQGVALERHQAFQTIRRLRSIDMKPTDMRRRELARPFVRRVLQPMLVRFGALGKKLTPANVVERLSQELAWAGSPEAWDAERVLAMKVLCAAVGAVAPRLLVPFGAIWA